MNCSQCGTPVEPHCANTCDWWRCPNKTCDHATFDLRRGILLHRDGQIEHVGN